MTELKAGDRVRCTLGENVIVGTVQEPRSANLHIVYGDNHFAFIEPNVWTVEVIEPEIDNFPREPGLYEVTWEDGGVDTGNPYEVGEDGRYRLTYESGSWSGWHKPDVYLRRATWKRLPDPLPPEPPIGTILRDRHGLAWKRRKSGWWRTGGVSKYYTWKQIQKEGPLTRLVPAPDPDDEQQVEAVAQAMRRADGRAQHAGLDVARAALTFLRDGGA